jgi:hypothetical protein
MFETDTFVPLVLFVTIAVIILGVAGIIADARTRRRLIEAGGAGDLARAMAAAAGSRTSGALKWGIVAIATGIALVAIQFLPYDRDEPIVLGILLLFVGAGLLVYYRLEKASDGPS